MTTLILIIIFSGIFGGTVNFFQLFSNEYKGWTNYFKCVIVGLGASFLVPLFLQMISSDLVEGTKTNDKDCLVFLGFCLIAAIFSRRFIETIGEKILKQVEKANETAAEAKEIAASNKEEVDLIASKATEVDPSDTVSAGIAEQKEVKESLKNDNLSFVEFGVVLRTLKDTTWTFRTLNGIVKDSGINKEKVEVAIEIFKLKDWIKEVNKDGKKLYALTDEGHRARLTE